jgi:hypothetical protein
MRNYKDELVSFVVFGLLVGALLLVTACSPEVGFIAKEHQPQVVSTPADNSQCPNGGSVITIGANQTIVCNGSNGAQGPQGAVGEQGPVGSQGPTGAPGLDGLNGNNGSPGTVVTPIQFCPNVTAGYPNNFPEYGLCVNNQMYGVYSTNGGFLALLPPGEYSSDGVNADCTFEIEVDCVVH